MKFMLMLLADEKAGLAIPPEQMTGFMDQLAAYQDTLAKAGAFVATAALQPTSTAKTISSVNDELKVHDGPYADTREQLAGYFFIDVPGIEQAVEWANRCPSAKYGAIEIRPIIEQTAS